MKIIFENVNFCYGKEKIIDDLSFEIKNNEFIVILGQNGSGKSTLCKLFNGILIPSSGNILIDDLNTREEKNSLKIHKKIGLVLQNPDNQIIYSIVEEDIAFGLESLGVKSEIIRNQIDKALKLVKMYEYKNHVTSMLSGGQKQRVAIAGILAMNPECIIFDEPTSMLDPVGRKEVLDIILDLNKNQKVSIVLITHNMEEAILADKILILHKGKIINQNTPEEIFSQIEFLKSKSLSVPQTTELLYGLKSKIKNNNISLKALTVDACTKEILRLFS
ncbi:MAG: energy-coupling factor transporter ATPase [Candidatus Paraimprobicoccus trichonymphae]|uniref:Energy-coupling factor transporter ATPase n=1 Tax=Candidatus Paraimprobicoccus trichonymphae TaxID=3033793 RepID=A0AA48IH92_9FIRM|nr:MAG: energy-coupling factor transporter ATPase [Candidatus Paraimprobicoccus trichonymphae]